MQSVLEQEVRDLLFRLRRWAFERDRAVLFGALLCCVPFLPVTFVGVLITLGNLLLLRLGKLSRAELPVLIAALVIAALWVVMWWAAFTVLLGSGLWLGAWHFWQGIWNMIWWFRPRGLGFDV